MATNQIVVINLAQGRLGQDTTRLLGALLVSQLEVATLARVDVPTADRTPFFLYVDEAHLLATPHLVEFLPEARKFQVGLILAHQYLAQISEELQAALLGNVGTFMVFRVGSLDADALAAEFGPTFTPADLVNLPARQACLKLRVDGTTSSPFSCQTLPPPQRSQSYREQIIAESRRRFARPVAEVEQDILQRMHAETPAYQQRLEF